MIPSGCSSKTAPAPTTAGMPSERAMIAVCEVGPPRAVQSPRMRLGSSRAVSEGVRSSATRITGSSGKWRFALLGAREEPQDALAHVVKVNGASSQALALHLPEVRNPRSSIACCHDHAALWPSSMSEDNFPAKVAVAEQRLVRTEDCRFVFAGTRLNCVVDGAELLARSCQRLLERTFLAVRVARCIFNHDLFAWNWKRCPIAKPGEAATPVIARTLDCGVHALILAGGASTSSSSPSPLSTASFRASSAARRIGPGSQDADRAATLYTEL